MVAPARVRRFLPAAALGFLVLAIVAGRTFAVDGILGSSTYRPEVVGRVGVVAAGRHFAAEAGMRMLARGGNAIDARVAAPLAARGTQISPLRVGGGGPLIPYLRDRPGAGG